MQVPARPCHDSRVDNTDKAPAELNKARTTRPSTDEFKRFLASGWGEADVAATAIAAAPYAAERRRRLSAMFPGVRIVAPAGDLKAR